MAQPGARQRTFGVKFQCPACRVLRGRDRHRDNATVFLDGRFGCAQSPGDRDHRRAIAEALGVLAEPLFEPLSELDAEL
jgi:hypothetical protein